jgi:hypothetical protein
LTGMRLMWSTGSSSFGANRIESPNMNWVKTVFIDESSGYSSHIGRIKGTPKSEK